MTPVLKRPSWNPTMSNRSGRLRDHLRHFKEGGFSGHNVIEKENCSHQVLKFVTIKTEQPKELKQALVRRTC